MRIKRRDNYLPPSSVSTIFLIPLFMYLLHKFSGVDFKREYVWWITLPILFLVAFFLIFKITFNKNEKNIIVN